LNVLYTPDDVEHIDYIKDMGFPGEYPFTRGVYASMYRGNLWSMRQYAGYGSAEETNIRYKYLLQQGQSGLSVAFDLPSQLGYDSDNPAIEEEVGRVGVAVDTLQDMEIIFQGIPLDKITTSFTTNPTAIIILAMYIALAEKQGVPLTKVGGTLQNDILKEYLARGTQIFPPRPSLRLVADIIEYCSDHLPRMNTISISGYHVREAGADAIQEIAFCYLDALVYVDEVLKRGISFDDFAPRLSFIFSCGLDLFEEVAKFRAARRLWAKIARERYGAKDPKAMMMRFFAGCQAHTYTAKEPLNNIVRGTVSALSAVLGGVNSLHVMAYDEAYAIPTAESARVGLRTQQILAHETGVTKVVDPLGGSYYIEWLTDKIENEISKLMERIDQEGGMLAAIEGGRIQREVLTQAYETEKKIQSGEKVVVGVNKYIADDGSDPDLMLHSSNPEVLKVQRERLEQVRSERNSEAVANALRQIRAVAVEGGNLVPPVLEAVRQYATMGEITDVFREVFGEYREVVSL
jgi:methylmalonyl-CoA mutase N-terminal domain/subunit